jgi:hypothetical protein
MASEWQPIAFQDAGGLAAGDLAATATRVGRIDEPAAAVLALGIWASKRRRRQ